MECAWTRYAGSAAEACRLTRRGLDDLAEKWAPGGCGPWPPTEGRRSAIDPFPTLVIDGSVEARIGIWTLTLIRFG
jgi:hypothetical protein